MPKHSDIETIVGIMAQGFNAGGLAVLDLIDMHVANGHTYEQAVATARAALPEPQLLIVKGVEQVEGMLDAMSHTPEGPLN